MLTASGIVFNVQRFSLHDGPGIRTTVFLKGCPLRCAWCCNPEGLDPDPQLAYRAGSCVAGAGCALCLGRCRPGAITAPGGGPVRVDFARCDQCLACVDACPARALEAAGRRMTVAQVMEAVEQDAPFYGRSAGGLTLSGGECTLQARFAAELLREAARRGLTTAVETCGHAGWSALWEVAALAEVVHYDVKHLDSRLHRAFTGAGNELILENLARLAAALPSGRIVVRTPIVPGFNASAADLRGIAAFLRGLPGELTWELLPFHRLGEAKHGVVGRHAPPMPADGDRSDAQLLARLSALAARGPVLVPLSGERGPGALEALAS